MDRFKFRAWDKKEKRMLDLMGPNFCEKGNHIGPIYTTHYYDFWHLNENFKANLDHFILMQCTGLKDKNNKLIYEGDVVKHKWINGLNQEMETIHFISYIDETCCFCMKRNSWSDHFTFSPSNKENEVIGNIYENPELLEPC